MVSLFFMWSICGAKTLFPAEYEKIFPVKHEKKWNVSYFDKTYINLIVRFQRKNKFLERKNSLTGFISFARVFIHVGFCVFFAYIYRFILMLEFTLSKFVLNLEIGGFVFWMRLNQEQLFVVRYIYHTEHVVCKCNVKTFINEMQRTFISPTTND